MACYYGLKLYIYNEINQKLDHKIAFKDLELRIFPLALNVRNLKDFKIRDKNIISFREINAEIPFNSIFAKKKTVNLYILEPKIIFDKTLFKKDKPMVSSKAFKINQVNIVDGELTYDTPKLYVYLFRFNLKSYPQEKGVMYRLTSPHLKAIFPLSGQEVKVEGQVSSEFKEQENIWKIGKFYWETQYARVSLNGKIYKGGRMALSAYIQGSARQILDPLLKEFSIREFMYGDARIRRNEKGLVAIEGKFFSNSFTCAGEAFNDLNGTINWDNRSNRITVNGYLYGDDLKTYLRVEAKKKKITISTRNASGAKLTRMINLYNAVPLGGNLKEGQISITGSIINGTVQMEKKTDPAASFKLGEFNAGGQVTFNYNTKKKEVEFSARGLQTEIGTITALTGRFTPKKRTQLRLDLESAIKDCTLLDKYTRFYINMPLDNWNLTEGNGTLALHLQKIDGQFYIDGDLLVHDLYSCGEKLETLTGRINTRANITRGTFVARDKDLKGEAALVLDSEAGNYRIDFTHINGEAKKLLNILELDLELTGRMKGNFVYSSNYASAPSPSSSPFLTGTFQADRINFYDFIFENISADLEYLENPETVSIKNIKTQYMTGSGAAEVYINYTDQQFDVSGKITGMDLQRMHNQFTGKADFTFSGRGQFDRDPITFDYRSGDIYFYADQSFTLNGSGKIFTDFSDYRLETRGQVLNKNSSSPFTLRLNQVNSQYSGDFQADITDINLLIPWGNNKGNLKVDGQITTGSDGALSAEGHADFSGEYLSFPNFPHTVDQFSGDLIFKDLNLTLRSLRGTLGDGPIESSGYLNIRNNQVEQLLLNLTGKNMNVHLIDRTGFTMDAELTLRLVGNKLLLSGTLDALSGIWEREVDEGVSFSTNPNLSASGSTVLDMLTLDLTLKGKENIQVRNSLGEIQAGFDLRLTGNLDFPVLTGVIDSRAGHINFSGKQFDLVKGKMIFNNKFTIDPLVDIESEAFIKNYRIKFVINGVSSKLKPELQSSPPLPTRDILTLIAVGELFRRPTSTELSSQIGTGTTDLIASELTEQIQKQTKKIFGDYLLRIDPYISNITGASLEDTSRLIVGKEISKDFLIVYSTNFSTHRQQVIYVHYQLTPALSLIGMRNEEGRLSIELRFRKRR
jgi:hypothetical protein